MHLSKSKYCNYLMCPKMLWLQKHKPEVAVIDKNLQSRFDKGNEVGDLAMGLLGDYTEVTTTKEDGSLDLNAMCSKTKECMDNGVKNICEASFVYDGLYCAVDILHLEEDGSYSIYEVKSTKHTQQKYIYDISYQKYILNNCGVNVSKTYLVLINANYVLQDALDITQLFAITDVTDAVNEEIQNIPTNLKNAEEVLSLTEEPKTCFSSSCKNCMFRQYCTRILPANNVFELYGFTFNKASKYYAKNIVTFDDVAKAKDIRLNKVAKHQLTCYQTNTDTIINKSEIKHFLTKLSYPMYFLDFETMTSLIPIYSGTKPNQQVPFQYSLHCIPYEGAEATHTAFLAESGANPLRSIAESLCANIPQDACCIVYFDKFEKGRLTELASLFPDLAQHLLAIRDNIVDMLVPFTKGGYYTTSMKDSCSLKSVVPALFPNDAEVDYSSLDNVHNGTDAMTLFPMIQNMSKEDAAKARQSLLDYCYLDTYTMVKIFYKFIDICK